MILSDLDIYRLCNPPAFLRSPPAPMIEPFVGYDEPRPAGAISYGLSSHGYDLRSNGEFLIYDRDDRGPGVIDPKKIKECDAFRFKVPLGSGEVIAIQPGGFMLTSSLEYFRLPRDVRGVCWGKSTYARCGLMCHVTPLECGWEGNLTIEISNQARQAVLIYVDDGICQVEFARVRDVQRSYPERSSKYQKQVGVTLPALI